MSPLLKKEIRLLLPGFLVGIVLALTNLLLPDFGISSAFRNVVVVFPFLCCPAIMVMLALNSFGSEISIGTFSNLLAQPMPRLRIWRMKVLLLAGALFIVGSLWCLCFYFRYSPFKMPNNPQDFGDVAVFVWTFLLVVFSGGLWTVLLLRQVAAAFWFTLLVPAALFVLTSTADSEALVLFVMSIYALAGFWFARRLFLRAQDTQWTGGTIAMPEIRGFSWWFAGSSARRRWRPRYALWRKELQLHQSQLIIAGVLALMNVGVIATRKLGHFQKNSVTEFVLESFWWLWLVMPVLVGCAAMAEERKMGVLESQLCLPVRRRTQFVIKFLVVLILAAAVGTLVPWLLEGSKILAKVNLEGVVGAAMGYHDNGYDYGYTYFPHSEAGVAAVIPFSVLKALYSLMDFLDTAAISAGLATIAFYGSSLSRNTLQGLAPSVLGLVLVWFIGFVASRPYDFGLGFLWRGPLFDFIAIPLMIAVVVALAYGNCQRMRITASVWLKNLLTLVIALALVTAASSAIYHRAWELLSSTEPTHGPARWTVAHPPRLQVTGDTGETIVVYLPDGRIWINRFAAEPAFLGMKFVGDQTFGGGKFLEGTNWTEVSDCWHDIVGVQLDGTLWVSKYPDEPYLGRPKVESKTTSKVTELERFGDRRDWKNVSARSQSPILLRQDGTLWIWHATNGWKWNQKWTGLHAFPPQRLGTDSDWDKLISNNGRTFLLKTNGQVWVEWGFNNSDETKRLPCGKFSIEISRASWLENREWTEAASFVCDAIQILVGVSADGTLREFGRYEWILTTKPLSKITGPHPLNHGSMAYVKQDIQIGEETNWLAMAAATETAITLKSDGTLWKWNFPLWDYPVPLEPPPPEPARTSPMRISNYSDWVAIAPMNNGVLSLAADGGLYLWRFESPSYRYNPWQDGALLQISRRPIFLGNIFSQSN